jgi:hypothetical protein
VSGVTVGGGPSEPKEAAVKRAVKGARDAGLEIDRVEVSRDGKIVIIARKPGEARNDRNEWDEKYGEDRP